jgi:hypothetical protein
VGLRGLYGLVQTTTDLGDFPDVMDIATIFFFLPASFLDFV